MTVPNTKSQPKEPVAFGAHLWLEVVEKLCAALRRGEVRLVLLDRAQEHGLADANAAHHCAQILQPSAILDQPLVEIHDDPGSDVVGNFVENVAFV